MNITPEHYPAEFNRLLFEELDLTDYRYKYLSDYINKAKEGCRPIYNTSVINVSNNGWILVLHGDMLLLYGEHWNIEQIVELSESFDLNNFSNYTLAGQEFLIDTLTNFFEITNIEVHKHRLFYQSSSIVVFQHQSTIVRLADYNELDDLALMMQSYFHEEYLGLNDKTIEEMRKQIHWLISNRKIYLATNNNNLLLGFCTIIDPDIGILYTSFNYRNNGYGKIILSYCASLLQSNNHIVYLMTDRDNVSSNILSQQVGFNPFFEYKMITIHRG